MVTTRSQMIADTSMKFAGTNPKTYLTIHETGNTSVGANAAAHANLQSRMWDWATWHWTVDDREAVQSYSENLRLWHAGDGQGHGNMSSIAIETCVNSDGNTAKTRRNLVELAAQIVVRNNIKRANIVQHNYWSGKNCPTFIRRDGVWDKLVSDIWAEAERLRGNKAPAPTPPAFSGDAKSYVGKQIDIDAWWNYKSAAEAEKLQNPVRVMPAGRYTVSKVSGKTPHLVNVNGKFSGWVHSSVLQGRGVVQAERTHKVVKGDTLWGISRQYGTTVDALRKKNGISGDLIHPGQVLRLP